MQLQDIEAELSYAYLHAVASRAGVACQASTRCHDNLGIDAKLSIVRDFGPRAVWSEVTLNVQLKATTEAPSRKDGRLSYYLRPVAEYDKLRRPSAMPPRLLAVLFLPNDPASWLRHSDEELALCRCAYWVSLLGAPASNNETGQTIYLPEQQALSPDGLLGLFERVAHREELRYETGGPRAKQDRTGRGRTS
jgi:hypothetical protein